MADAHYRAKGFIHALAGIGVDVIAYSFVRPLASPLDHGFSVQNSGAGGGGPCHLLLRDSPDEESWRKIKALAKAHGLSIFDPA